MINDSYFTQLAEEGRAVDMPDELRAKHQPDPYKLSEGCQCHCSCGAECGNYVVHLHEVADHAVEWERLCAERGHPMEAFIRAGIDPRRLP